jgi:hypothetical protein
MIYGCFFGNAAHSEPVAAHKPVPQPTDIFAGLLVHAISNRCRITTIRSRTPSPSRAGNLSAGI